MKKTIWIPAVFIFCLAFSINAALIEQPTGVNYDENDVWSVGTEHGGVFTLDATAKALDYVNVTSGVTSNECILRAGGESNAGGEILARANITNGYCDFSGFELNASTSYKIGCTNDAASHNVRRKLSVSIPIATTDGEWTSFFYESSSVFYDGQSNARCVQSIWLSDIASSNTPPTILSYNLQDEAYGNCTSWDTDTSTECQTEDTTPTVSITTDDAESCAIGLVNQNFTSYSDRNCTVSGANSFICSVIAEDELVYEDSYIYISCIDSNGNENTTSTSGPLTVQVMGLEEGSEESIEYGIQNALISDYTIYNDQLVYVTDDTNTLQDFGTFDRFVKKGNKAWAFNYITKGEEHTGLFNLSPVLYILEMANNTNSTIINLVETMINETK